MAEKAAAPAETGAIEAELNYIVDDGVPASVYVDWPEEANRGHPPTYEPRRTVIRDGRPLRDRFTLPDHGFAFVERPTAVGDFDDPDLLARVYDPEVAALVREHTGAARVVVFDHTVRRASSGRSDRPGVRPPVKAVHNDYTERSAPRRVRDLLPADEADAALSRRFAIVQTWRPIGAPVESEPLAICDGTTIAERGFVRFERRYPHRTAETYHISHDPGHRWYWFPRMTPDEVIVFKVFDTDASAGVRFTAHTGFDDPTSPAGARPRESIESRAFAFF